jgi:hypothetical protein
VAQHGHERHHPGAAAHEQHRGGVVAVPHEPAPDRAAQLDLVAHVGDAGQVGRHLTVVEDVRWVSLDAATELDLADAEYIQLLQRALRASPPMSTGGASPTAGSVTP